ncbi:MAG TPA: FkbM family methyltransferase [Stellaceae bacterium]
MTAANNATLKMLNTFYTMMSDRQKALFHAHYAKIFRERGVVSKGEWTITFNGRKIKLPLRPLWSWLDWDSAVSILGHDLGVKQTYAALLESKQRPALFLDVGANYGTHSVLFLAAGVPTISFEPNPECFSHFDTICKLNGLVGRWERVALGSQTGEVELAYPEKDTWFGSVAADVSLIMKESFPVRTQKVMLKPLDDYFDELASANILIKIDVEGFEPDVLRGARQIIVSLKPKIIFESNTAQARPILFGILGEFGYSIHLLPWRPFDKSPALTFDQFLASAATNFIAITRPT